MKRTPSHPRNVIGPTIARLRSARGMSQAQLAAHCQRSGWDVSRSVIAAIEGRARWVGDFEAAILAQILACELADLFPKKIDWAELNLPYLQIRR